MSISHNIGLVIKLESEPIFEYKNFPSNDNDYGMGDLNYTPHL
jgi:hypothetical protein